MLPGLGGSTDLRSNPDPATEQPRDPWQMDFTSRASSFSCKIRVIIISTLQGYCEDLIRYSEKKWAWFLAQSKPLVNKDTMTAVMLVFCKR